MRPKVMIVVAVGRSSVATVDAVERVDFETRRAVRVFEARHTIVIDVVVDGGDRCRTRGSGIVVPRHQCVALDAVRGGAKVGASAGAAATATGAAGTGARAPRWEFRLICDDCEPRSAAPCGVYRVEADEMR